MVCCSLDLSAPAVIGLASLVESVGEFLGVVGVVFGVDQSSEICSFDVSVGVVVCGVSVEFVEAVSSLSVVVLSLLLGSSSSCCGSFSSQISSSSSICSRSF